MFVAHVFMRGQSKRCNRFVCMQCNESRHRAVSAASYNYFQRCHERPKSIDQSQHASRNVLNFGLFLPVSRGACLRGRRPRAVVLDMSFMWKTFEGSYRPAAGRASHPCRTERVQSCATSQCDQSVRPISVGGAWNTSSLGSTLVLPEVCSLAEGGHAVTISRCGAVMPAVMPAVMTAVVWHNSHLHFVRTEEGSWTTAVTTQTLSSQECEHTDSSVTIFLMLCREVQASTCTGILRRGARRRRARPHVRSDAMEFVH